MPGLRASPPSEEDPPIETFGDFLSFMKDFRRLLEALPAAEQEEGRRLLREMSMDYIEGVSGTRRLTASSIRIERLTTALIVLTAVLSITTAILLYRSW